MKTSNLNQEQDLTNFTINLQAIMFDQDIKDNFINFDTVTQDFLLETYNPILAELESLYKSNPLIRFPDSRLVKIAKDIYQLSTKVESLAGKIDQQNFSDYGKNGDIKTQLAFVFHSIINNKSNLKELIEGTELHHGLNSRLSQQFVKDFFRMPAKVIDQNGNVIIKDITKAIAQELIEQKKEKNLSNISLILKDKLKLSNQQLKFMISRFHQRSIDAVSTAFLCEAGNQMPRSKENTFKVEIDSAGDIVRFKSIYTEYSNIAILNNDSEIPRKEEVSTTKYHADLEGLNGEEIDANLIAFPTQIVPETITYKAINSLGNVNLNQALRTRTDLDELKLELNLKENYFSSLENDFDSSSHSNSTYKTARSDSINSIGSFYSTRSRESFDSIGSLEYNNIPKESTNSPTKKSISPIFELANKAYSASQDKFNTIAQAINGKSLTDEAIPPSKINYELLKTMLFKQDFDILTLSENASSIDDLTSNETCSLSPESISSNETRSSSPESIYNESRSSSPESISSNRTRSLSPEPLSVKIGSHDLPKSESIEEEDMEIIDSSTIETATETNNYLLYKENKKSIMFIARACNDINQRKDKTKFITSGGRNISDALVEITTSRQYKEAKRIGKSINIALPLALTKERNHWVTAIINEGVNNSVTVEIIDSAQTYINITNMQGYDYTSVAKDIKKVLENFNSEIEVKYTKEQPILDDKSCGYHVMNNISACASKFNLMERAVNQANKIMHNKLDKTSLFVPKILRKNSRFSNNSIKHNNGCSIS